MKKYNEIMAKILNLLDTDRRLKDAMREWFVQDGGEPSDEARFKARCELQLIFAAIGIGKENETPEEVIAAMRVNCLGVKEVEKIRKALEAKNYETDMTHYVEEGTVSVGLYIEGEEAEMEADRAADYLRDKGWDAEVCCPGDIPEFIVEAEMPFDTFFKMQKERDEFLRKLEEVIRGKNVAFDDEENGTIYMQVNRENETLDFGGACNTGMLVDFSYNIDFDLSVEKNFLEAVEEATAHYGF